ncbi:MAG: toxic anion resistance protein, partial [Zymomonas sp.]
MSDFELTAPITSHTDDVIGFDGIVILEAKRRADLDVKARQFASELVAIEPRSPQYADRVVQLAAIGRREIEALSAIGERPRAQPGSTSVASGNIGRLLTELRAIAQSLDPARAGDLLQPRKLFGLFPMGDRLKAYFDSYRSAQRKINDVLSALATSRDDLLRDIVIIDAERAKMQHAMRGLQESIYAADSLDSRFERMAEAMEAAQPSRAHAIREEPIFQLRQRRMELLTHMAVATQAYLALGLIRNSNLKLAKGVD